MPDAIGRTLLLTRFSVVPLLNPGSSWLALPATPSTLLLVPFILAVPFAALAFTGANLFAPAPALATPAELQPWGWTAVDAWLPLVLPALFLALVGPADGWPWALGTRLSEDAAIVVCTALTIALFVARAVYNFGPQTAKQWKRAVGLAPRKAKKIKKA